MGELVAYGCWRGRCKVSLGNRRRDMPACSPSQPLRRGVSRQFAVAQPTDQWAIAQSLSDTADHQRRPHLAQVVAVSPAWGLTGRNASLSGVALDGGSRKGYSPRRQLLRDLTTGQGVRHVLFLKLVPSMSGCTLYINCTLYTIVPDGGKNVNQVKGARHPPLDAVEAAP